MANAILPFFIFMSFVLLEKYSTNAQLSPLYYSTTCPNLQSIVTDTMKQAISQEPRMGPSILRLFFHDCFVNGCDASVLLDDTETFTGEKNAFPNKNSLRGFEVIDDIKTNVESSCNGTVSCADILALAAQSSVSLLGGPTWSVPLGRKDAKTASQTAANSNLPPPTATLKTLISMFSSQGLTPRDMTALSGAHTLGQAQCSSFRTRIYTDTNINSTFATSLQGSCPGPNSGTGDSNLTPLDSVSPDRFDNGYFQDLVAQRGLLHSDQVLFNNGSLDGLVRVYSTDYLSFARDFANAMVKMGNIKPLTGSDGEIRISCRVVNQVVNASSFSTQNK